VLDQLSGNIADIYAAKSGKSADDMRALMRAETWFTAAEAVAAGLADSVQEISTPEPSNRSAGRPAAAATVIDREIAANAQRRRRGETQPPTHGGNQ
jgi:hypothetical protein